MVPLRVTATLASDIANPLRPPALDALLAYAQAVFVEGRDPPDPSGPVPPVDISHAVALAPCGRYHLVSFALAEVEEHLRGRFINRRFPLSEAQSMAGPKLTRISLAGGPCKSFRLPIETAWLKGDQIEWFAVGDPERVRALLVWITHLGKRRGVGLGKIAAWEVEPCASWGDGFPVIRDGRPLRNLPLDAMEPEAGQLFEGYGNLTFPYFERDREELCLVAS